MCCKKLKTQNAIESVRKDDTYTLSWKETAEVLLDNLFGYDNDINETENQMELRNRMYKATVDMHDTENEYTIQELAQVINKMKNGKAPGWDAIEVVVVKRAWTLIQNMFKNVFNGCLKFGVFPNEWKKACVVTLLKSKDKDSAEPSSYKPVCLLPVLGKLMEGLLLLRIRDKIELQGSDNQFGFRRGICTDDAISKFMKQVNTVDEKYTMGIILDITGTFNHLWWPDIIEELKLMKCSIPIVMLLQDYLRQRNIVFRTENGEIEREINKGCPQGSLLGPLLWILVFNGLIIALENAGFKIIVYANDGVILVTGNTRMELQNKGQIAINIAKAWCDEHKMSLSTTKTVLMLLKGNLDKERPPTIKLETKNKKMVKEMKYLGIILSGGITKLKID